MSTRAALARARSRRRSRLLAAIAVSTLAGGLPSTPAQARKPPSLSVSAFARSSSPSSGRIGAEITVSRPAAGAPASSGGASSSRPAPPTLPANAPILSNQTPAGPGSYWYTSPAGTCIYAPGASPICFVIVEPGSGSVNVPSTAAQLASQLDLALAPIEASPAPMDDGLTGASSWFWLAGAPSVQQLSLTLAGETVTVLARPGAVGWSFGDGSTLSGGAGVPFAGGAPPPDAVTHVYQTRCLPGDAGNDPFVLPSCGPDGYEVAATVTWTVSYAAQGPLDSQASLPSITTQSSLSYPVSEARAFLEETGQ